MANMDTLKGQWTQFKGEARKQWGKLTDNEWDQMAGERDKLVGRLQELYGWSREQAHDEVDRFFTSRNSNSPDMR